MNIINYTSTSYYNNMEVTVELNGTVYELDYDTKNPEIAQFVATVCSIEYNLDMDYDEDEGGDYDMYMREMIPHHIDAALEGVSNITNADLDAYTNIIDEDDEAQARILFDQIASLSKAVHDDNIYLFERTGTACDDYGYADKEIVLSRAGDEIENWKTVALVGTEVRICEYVTNGIIGEAQHQGWKVGSLQDAQARIGA